LRCALPSLVDPRSRRQRAKREWTQRGTPFPSEHWRELEGDDLIDDVILVDQSPIGRTPRSNPVTYIKAFDGIRDLFASLPESKKRGFSAGHFSFNIPGGRCETCQGDGTVTVEMQFLADVELVCEECKGARYKPQALEVRYRGKNIHEVLNLTVKKPCTSSPAYPGSWTSCGF
jgi:excinuclease ABC subunit A